MLARIAVFVSLLALCKGESYALEEKEIDLEKRAAVSCPSSHPYAYYGGKWCCKSDMEKTYAPQREKCDGSVISRSSLCCAGDQHVRCPKGSGCVDNFKGCKTTKGERCMFPYKYKGVTYNTCTGTKPWCSVENKKDGNYKRWGRCNIPSCFVPSYTCQTTKGQKCVFPFKYKGKKYSTCTSAGYHGRPWCSVENKENGYYKKWGRCSPSHCTAKPKPSCKKPCNRMLRPVCGSDGKTYSNECALKNAACDDKSLKKVHDGRCAPATTAKPSCKKPCNRNLDLVCGSDGKTYNNECALENAACDDKSLKKVHDGPCRAATTAAPTEPPTAPQTEPKSELPTAPATEPPIDPSDPKFITNFFTCVKKSAEDLKNIIKCGVKGDVQCTFINQPDTLRATCKYRQGGYLCDIGNRENVDCCVHMGC